MGAAFAIQVLTGKETNVKRLMEWAFSKNPNAQKWIKAIHTFSQTTQRVLKSGELGKRVSRASVPGYIFLEMHYSVDGENTSAYIADDVWHLIKSIPGVLKQFTRSGQIISAEEFQQMLGLDLDDQVEVATPIDEDVSQHKEAEKLAKAEHEVKLALHQVNTVHTPQEREQAKQAFDDAIQNEAELLYGHDQVEMISSEMASLDEQHKSNPVISRIKSILRNNREIIRLPRITLQQIGIQEDDKPLAHVVIDRLRQFIHMLGMS